MIKSRIKPFEDMMEKLYLRWRDGQELVVLMYTPLRTIGFSDIANIDELKQVIQNIPIDMLLIKTSKKEHQIITNRFDTYSFRLSSLNIKYLNGDTEKINF